MSAVFDRTDGRDSDACFPAHILPFFLLRDASSLVSVAFCVGPCAKTRLWDSL
jgi:hypothetical protein